MAKARRPYRILLPLANPSTARNLVRIASAIRPRRPTQITALGIVEVPDGVSLSHGAIEARTARRLLQRVLDFGDEQEVEIQTAVRIGRRVSDGIVEAVAEQQADLVIFGWAGPDAAKERSAAGGSRRTEPHVFSTTIDAVVREAPCDIAVVKQRELDGVQSILVPVRGGPHAELAMRLAKDLASKFGARRKVLHVVPRGIGETARARQQEALKAFLADHRGGPAMTGELVEAESIRQAIISEAANHDLVVMGASAEPGHRSGNGKPLFGTVADAVVSRAKPTVVVVQSGEAVAPDTFEQLRADVDSFPAADAFVAESRSLPSVVDRWFAENTFHASEFRDIHKLVELKERAGLTVSVGLPALNEAATIGTVIRRIKGPLMQEMPLVDQLVVIDSDSTDRTREIAESLDVPVFSHSQILPETGTHVGKGEALWKSLHVLDGDIVAWVDTDVRNFRPHFVYGLLGPLLREPRVSYVKGFYQRPLKQAGVVHAEGGGRVTELMARPLLNLFFPELSGVIQPLSGEYAGRRSLLETVPFFTGYAVEIGLLIDALEQVGLSAIAQVDLERRVHRNQTLINLSQMAYAILQAAMRKLEDRHRIELLSETGRGMKLINQGPEQFNLEVRDIGDAIRPPITTIPAYHEERRQRAGG